MMDNSFHDVRLPHTGNDNDYHLLSNNIPIVALGWSGYLSCTEKKNQAHSIRNIIVLLCCAAWMKIEGKRPLVFKSQHSNMNIIICRCCGVCKWTQKKICLGVTKCYWTFQEHFDTQVDKRGKLSVNYMNPAVSGWNGHIFENLENLWKTVQTTHGATNTNAEVLLLLRQGDTYPLISFDIKGTRPLVRLQRGASRGMVLRSGGDASRWTLNHTVVVISDGDIMQRRHPDSRNREMNV